MSSHPRPSTLSRRAASVAMIAAPYLWLGTRAQAQAARQLTPSQTEGPFYPVKLPKDVDYDLLRNGTQSYTAGQAVWVQGSVTDIDGKPVAGAISAFRDEVARRPSLHASWREVRSA